MPDMNFLNVHLLSALPYSNLNRDDVGAPKSLDYGGIERARLSSQALKRAARTQFEAGSRSDRTTRSKYLPAHVSQLVLGMLSDAGVNVDDTLNAKVCKASEASVRKLITKTVTKGEPGKTDTVVWLAETEALALAQELAEKLGEDVAIGSSVQPATDSLTIAAFGRMFAESPDLQTDAAIQVAHAFTTHGATVELDYFIAADDLRSSFKQDSGAGHLDLAQFTSGVFYRYFNVDRRQLRDNWTSVDEDSAESRFADFMRSMILALPSGKTNATAPVGFPYYVLAESSTLPLSYAAAFETPGAVQPGGGFLPGAVSALKSYAARSRKVAGSMYGPGTVVTLDPDIDTSSFDDLVEMSWSWLRNGQEDA